MTRSVLLVGGSGFIGSRLALRLRELNYHIGIVSRGASKLQDFPNVDEVISWDKLEKISEYDAIINLTGANIGGHRWTKEYKRIILDSRLTATQKIVTAINKYKNKTSVFISVSAIGFYGDRGDEVLDESSSQGADFLANVCAEWEAESRKALDIRVVNPRFGIVLDSREGALAKLITPIKYFVGGALGTGKQWMSWIHIDDLISSLVRIIEDESIIGAVNIVAPEPVTNAQFIGICAKLLKRPSIFPIPEFVLKCALGEQSSIVLASQRVRPIVLEKINFEYKYYDLTSALKNLLNE